jgi:hypothetical protein
MWWVQFVAPHATRHRLTRLLCWLSLASAVTCLILWVAAVVSFINSTASAWAAEMVIFLVWSTALLFLAHAGCRILLRLWRRCDRCGYHLFPIWGGMLAEMSWPRVSYFPHYLAPQFLGSFAWGAIVSMTFRGVTHCMACGYADGARPALAPESDDGP